ncbi:Uncharacterized protein HZ326_9864 [Fusarium oxysporum f. sp. albedinis]|nr:hypothetical protein HZ326_27102 [Fusarium oxysporum f. sp. albedinis]KAJ0147449.1 Uncharacterized protein HZ326_9864 [Fusarium oxysporum f. sp. albedinis]
MSSFCPMACYLPVDGGGLRCNFEVGYTRERSRGAPAAESNEQSGPTVPRTACNLLNYTLFVRALAPVVITFMKLHPFYPCTLVGFRTPLPLLPLVRGSMAGSH